MSVASCTLARENFIERQTRSGIEITGLFNIKLNRSDTPQYLLSTRVIDQAHGASPNPLPFVNDTLAVQVDGTTYTSSEIRVDSIVARPKRGSELSWLARVVWKTPDETSGSGNAPSDQEKDPWLRAPEYRSETLVLTEPRDRGKNLQEIKFPWLIAKTGEGAGGEDGGAVPQTRPIGTDFFVTNAAGFRYGNLPTKQVRLPVFVFSRFVRNPYAWIPVDQAFRDTTNRKEWKVWNRDDSKVDAGNAAYWHIENDGPFYRGTIPYYQLTARVIFNPEGHLIRVPNEGDKAWVRKDGTINQFVLEVPTRNGLHLQPPIPMSIEGQFLDSPDQAANILEFEDLEQADYDSLNTRLANLA